ncbi:ornithine cyclodeaminase family protein [Ponticaulis profundi]|uniref:Ornithine cyclodeaminase family protein n=1 Tax=Ponticaulis profundi TaxID=2665222 RepID=A0ABW1S775_9PROT
MQYFSADDVAARLPHADCIEVMKTAMMKLSSGETEQMLRQILPLGAGNMFGIMAGTLGEQEAFGSKLISVSPERKDKSRPSHQGVVVLFDKETLAPYCLADAGQITAIRTACASAMATDLLARRESSILTILGTGEQAHHHALAISKIRWLDEIRIWGRTPDKARALANAIQSETRIPTTAEERVENAARDADIICTVTGAFDPILTADMVAPGTHLNIVGSSFDGPREIDDALVSGARFFADSKPSVAAQGSEYRHALASGVIREDHMLGEIGEVALGTLAGRTSDADITIYKSLGHIVQDIAAAAHIQAKSKG